MENGLFFTARCMGTLSCFYWGFFWHSSMFIKGHNFCENLFVALDKKKNSKMKSAL